MILIKDLKVGDILESNEIVHYKVIGTHNSPSRVHIKYTDEDGRDDHKQFTQEELNDSEDMLHLIHYRKVNADTPA